MSDGQARAAAADPKQRDVVTRYRTIQQLSPSHWHEGVIVANRIRQRYYREASARAAARDHGRRAHLAARGGVSQPAAVREVIANARDGVEITFDTGHLIHLDAFGRYISVVSGFLASK